MTLMRSTYLFALATITPLMVWTSEAFAQQKLGTLPDEVPTSDIAAPATAMMEKETDPRLLR